MKISVSYAFEVRYAPKELCDRFGKPYGTIEIIDPEGDRAAWAESEEDAHDTVVGICTEAFMSPTEVLVVDD